MSESQTTEDKHLSLFEKYLPLWVAVCMLAGILNVRRDGTRKLYSLSDPRIR